MTLGGDHTPKLLARGGGFVGGSMVCGWVGGVGFLGGGGGGGGGWVGEWLSGGVTGVYVRLTGDC